MAFKITDVTKDLPKLNIELSRLDQHEQQLSKLQTQLGQLQKQLLLNSTVPPENHLSQNNLTFTWTGSTLTLSWAAGYIHSNGHYLHVAAGSKVLVANTYYWMGWNQLHQTMSAQTDYNKYIQLQDPDTVSIICQLYTGTGAQTGSAGGGGTEPGGVGNNGKQYKLF